jgi:hypothetical protein
MPEGRLRSALGVTGTTCNSNDVPIVDRERAGATDERHGQQREPAATP